MSKVAKNTISYPTASPPAVRAGNGHPEKGFSPRGQHPPSSSGGHGHQGGLGVIFLRTRDAIAFTIFRRTLQGTRIPNRDQEATSKENRREEKGRTEPQIERGQESTYLVSIASVVGIRFYRRESPASGSPYTTESRVFVAAEDREEDRPLSRLVIVNRVVEAKDLLRKKIQALIGEFMVRFGSDRDQEEAERLVFNF